MAKDKKNKEGIKRKDGTKQRRSSKSRRNKKSLEFILKLLIKFEFVLWESGVLTKNIKDMLEQAYGLLRIGASVEEIESKIKSLLRKIIDALKKHLRK